MFNMNKNKKILLISSISLAVIIVLGIVYAAFTQQLNIAGSATGRSSKWDIHFENLSNVSLNGTAKELTAPTINTNSTQISNYSVSLTSPGDYVEYTFDVVNDGDYDATLTNLSKTAPSCQGTGDNASTDASNVCGKLTYTLTYADGTTVSQSDTLKSKETKTMKLKLLYQEFNDDSLLPKMDVTITGLGIQLTYTQNGNAKVNENGTTPYVAPQSSYSVGQQITVANETYHVISVPASSDYVVALKDVPLKATEITAAGGTVGYTYSDTNATGGMAYHALSSTYGTSAIKSVVDSWAAAKFTDELKTIDGYSARLITYDELQVEQHEVCQTGNCYQVMMPAYDWMYSSDFWYWTMTPWQDGDSEPSSSHVWGVYDGGRLYDGSVYVDRGAVRPVINVYKSKISS